MTILYTEHFKLDLSHLSIKFSEENPFFEKDLIKQQSFPFKIPRERSFIPFFEFVSSHNSVDSNILLNGTLYRQGNYYEAEILIMTIKTDLEMVIYFSFDKLTIFDTPLKALPWETLTFDNMFTFANATKQKNYPETVVNFVQINDAEKHRDYEYGNYKGFINYCKNGSFIEFETNVFGLTIPLMNELRPFLYIKHILKFIFNQIDYTIDGDLMTSPSLNKALQYHSNSLFYTYKDYVQTNPIILGLFASDIENDYPGTMLYNDYLQEVGLPLFANSYNVNIKLTGALANFTESQCKVEVYFNDLRLALGFASNYAEDAELDFEMEFNFPLVIPQNLVGTNLEIRVECQQLIKDTIEGEFEITGTARPLYADSFNLGDLLPDLTVGEYIKNFKESFNMTSVFNSKTNKVTFNFFNSFINNQNALDLSDYAISEPSRRLNKLVGYKINFSDDQIIYLSKKGDFIPSAIGYTDISIPIEPLPTLFINSEAHVKHQDAISLFFYDSNTNALPSVNDGDISYSRIGFINQFLRNWYFQNLNAEEYNFSTDIPLFKSLKLNAESKLKMYNNIFSVHSLKRQDKGALFEKIDMRLFKIKNTKQFATGIDNTDFEYPVAITAIRYFDTTLQPPSFVYTQTSNFEGQISDGGFFGWNPIFVTSKIYADLSFDPQGLDIYFGWELISSPNGDLSANFIAENSNSSIVTFSKNVGFASTALGDYYIRLKVTNAVGLVSSVVVIVNVSENTTTPPPQKIFINQVQYTTLFDLKERFTLVFDDYITTSVTVFIQEFNISTQQNIGNAINYGTITNFTLAEHEVTFPNPGTWKLRVESADEVSNELAWVFV